MVGPKLANTYKQHTRLMRDWQDDQIKTSQQAADSWASGPQLPPEKNYLLTYWTQIFRLAFCYKELYNRRSREKTHPTAPWENPGLRGSFSWQSTHRLLLVLLYVFESGTLHSTHQKFPSTTNWDLAIKILGCFGRHMALPFEPTSQREDIKMINRHSKNWSHARSCGYGGYDSKCQFPLTN